MGSIALTLGIILLLCALYQLVGLSNLKVAIGIGIVALFLLQCGAKMILNGSKASGRAPCCALYCPDPDELCCKPHDHCWHLGCILPCQQPSCEQAPSTRSGRW